MRLHRGPLTQDRYRKRRLGRQDLRETASTAVYVIRAGCLAVCLLASAALTVVEIINGRVVIATLPGGATIGLVLLANYLFAVPAPDK